MQFRRYAIFYTPPPGPLAEFGAAWLGWDPARGCRVAQCAVAGVAASEITDTPRKYGFHGTIKPPFALAKGRTEAGLIAAFSAFCKGAEPVVLEGLEIAHLGRFLALVPIRKSDALLALAADVVQTLDGFRAPLSKAESARRRARNLSPRQEEMLENWGYPFVIDEFRFHLTLTGRLSRAQGAQVTDLLRPVIAPLVAGPLMIDGLSLMGEDEAGMFHLIVRQHFLREENETENPTNFLGR